MHYWGVWRNFIIRILCGETSSLECHPKLDVPLPQGQATRKPSLRQRNGVVKWRREMKRTSTSRLLNALSIICYTFHAPHSLSCNAFLWLSAMRKCSYAHEVTSVVWCQCMQPLSKGRMEEGGGEVDIYVFDFPANYTCRGDSYFRCLEIVCLSGQYTLIIPHRTNQLTIGISFRRKKKREGLLHDDSIILLEFQCWLIQTEWELGFLIFYHLLLQWSQCHDIFYMAWLEAVFYFLALQQWQEARP